MPTPPLLDFESLLAPIPGDDPAGAAVSFALRDQLEQFRKQIDPSEYDPKDPTRPTDFKHADWAGIIRLTSEALQQSSKDLMLAARLTEALARQHGFAGLRDGLRFQRRLVEEGWDRLRPIVEEPDDLESRAAPFHWLDDPDRGSRFPTTVRCLPMLMGQEGPISWLDWQQIQTGKGPITAEIFERAVTTATRDDCQALSDDLSEACDEVTQLTAFLSEKMGNYAPSLSSMRRSMVDCQTLAKLILERKGPAAATEEGEGETAVDGGEGVEGGSGGKGESSAPRTRAQIYQRLSELSEQLQKIEPHSPIPYLIRWAVDLGGLSYPDLMKRLVQDQSVLSDLSRLLGIPELRE